MQAKFFLICPIGLEFLAEQELRRKWASLGSTALTLETLKGGLALECDLELGLALNSWLRLPGRILLRLKTQKCRDLPKLYQIIRKFPWRQWLVQDNVVFQVDCHQSKLMHTGRIATSAQDAWSDFIQGQPLANFHQQQSHPAQKIFLRLENDDLTISLDTSGEHLHKRGHTTHRGHAAIRENLAAACLEFLFAGDNSQALLDPMCGSGTFLTEYALMNQPLARDFAFSHWHPKVVSALKQVPLRPATSTPLLFGYDRDPLVLPQTSQFSLTTKKQDFFQLTDPPAPHLIMNPPYGKRVKIHQDKQTYFQKIIDKIQQLPLKRAGLIIPYPYAKQFNYAGFDFNQNGIKVKFCQVI